MSNLHYSSENAAPAAAPVSPASPCRPVGDMASATPPTTHSSPDQPLPPCSAGAQDVPHAPAPPVVPVQLGRPASAASTVSVTSVPQASPSSGDQIKYHRGPAVLARPHGPSLLTQALATARGIQPPATRPELASHTKTPHPHPPPPAQAVEPHSSVRDPDEPNPHNASSPPSDGNSLTPRASPRGTAAAMPSSTAVATAVAYPYRPADTPPSKQYNMLDLGEVNSMLSGHRDYLAQSGGKGTSVERLDRERWTNDRPSKPAPFPYTHNIETPSSMYGGNTDIDNTPVASSDLRARKAEHRLSMGPEKAWSISTGERPGHEDGQVEKSITEAIAGVEPNARTSRKASHSLRFFKEGNPDDKTKKKDPRHTAQLRDKLPPTPELSESEKATRGSEGASTRPVSIVEDGTPGADKSGWLRSIASDSLLISASPDEVTLENGVRDLVLDVKSKELPPRPISSDRQVSDSRATVLDATLETGQQLDVVERVCEVMEDGEESGEEKISSALFLPHQAPEQSEEEASLPGVPPRSVPPSRTVSRADDFHPWLVKADEPEVDDKVERVDFERKLRPETGADIPLVAPEVDSTQVDGSAIADESESGVRPPRPSRPVSQYQEDLVHDHQWAPKQPLEAIELIPYKHQVGGHTTLWRFSRRAVCKQLNNRENEFYEKVEKYHRDLLAFLPRYIGVLNVTFQKKPRRKSTLKRDEVAAVERVMGQIESGVKADEEGDTHHTSDASVSTSRHRVVSQSLQPPQNAVPTVTFVDNQHILPRNLLQPTPNSPVLAGRLRSASASVPETKHNGHGTPEAIRGVPVRPSLQDHQAHSWGATTVNKKLRNEVFNDAFLKQPITVRRHRKAHHRSVPRRALQQALRPTGSDPSLAVSRGVAETPSSTKEQAIPRANGHTTQSQGGVECLGGLSEDEEAPKDVTGTSAPEPEILADSSPAQKKKRRYSGTGLRRKPKDVRDSRGDLKYYEEADDAAYKSSKAGRDRDATRKELPERPETPKKVLADDTKETVLSTVPSSAALELPSPTSEFKKIPRPINPKEAQTQRDSRVEYFLLLEDLTAGMKRPCIMDLKMGTRQYGVDANPKKQKSQQGKCAKTTSRELGVRVCGLQVWDVKSQSYVFKDKYYGRDLKKGQEFQDALARFLYDGVDRGSILRHIPTVLQKLDQLEVIISRLRGYRFYAASLLMFYDGDNSEDYEGVIEDSTTDFATDTEELPRRTRRNPREIDFKMADFANCITAGDVVKDKPCPPRYPNEPDRGFLKGLRSLRKYFLKIQKDTRAEMGLVLMQPRGVNGNGNGNGHDAVERKEENEGYVSE